MAGMKSQTHATRPPPTHGVNGHTLPRRTSPANSVTLRHHRLARDASRRANPGASGPTNTNSNTTSTNSPRRNSSGESHDTGASDPMKWFDQSNQNPTATFDNNVMDVDPPFFQKESDSSNEERGFSLPHLSVPPKLTEAQSSSADDYRSVIDDLTVEIQKLKEELKRYKQKGPDMLKKEKLFEIKFHGLPRRKKRELETTLRDFAAGLEGSPDASSSQRKKSSRHNTRDQMYSGSGSMSKHASSSSGSNARPVDSAYASMSTGANSSGTSMNRPYTSSHAKASEQKVENYLRDIPEGLYPRHMVMTDKEKKKLVVRRLEQLFTGKISGKWVRRNPLMPPAAASAIGGVVTDGMNQQRPTMHQPPKLLTNESTKEAAREARILPTEQQEKRGKKSTRDNASASNSNGDQTESRGNGNSSSTTDPSPPDHQDPPEQRPTHPKDLDPDRTQVPSENMDYIRHLGLVPPELLAESTRNAPDVSPDADGWVYLNLLCNLAQLHIINVTPDFVRRAVCDMSAKFQLSPDGRKIRWRGGSEGTRFSDSSGDNSQRSPDTDDTEADDQRKRQKTGHSTETQSGSSTKNPSKFGPQISGSSESFHYKPLFVHQESSHGQTSMDDTLSSFGPVEESNLDESRWGLSGSGTSNRRKRRHDGAIIYYSGAPFCTDLAGDPGDTSPTAYMRSSGQEQEKQDLTASFARPPPRRSPSGSSLVHRPLSEEDIFNSKMEVDEMVPGLTTDSGNESSDVDFELPWSDNQQFIDVHTLEPCGLGGVLPDDHFMVVVTTKRPKNDAPPAMSAVSRGKSEETEGVINRLASMSTSSPAPVSKMPSQVEKRAVEIEYMSGRIKRLAPVSLPPPAIFFPPFSTDGSSSDGYEFGSEEEDDEDEDADSAEFTSRRANPHQSDDYPDGVDLSSGDEDGEDPDDEPDAKRMYDRQNESTEQIMPQRRRVSAGQSFDSADAAPPTQGRRSKSASAEQQIGGDRSSAATAGGVASGYSSSEESS